MSVIGWVTAALVLTAGVGAAQDERGVATDAAEGFEAGYAKRHALVVGIDDYAGTGFPTLAHAVADARSVAKVLIEQYGFEQGNVKLLLNEDATKAALDAALEDWAGDPDRVGEEDLFVLFFAGHGETRSLGRRGSRGYLVPADGQREEWSSLLGMDEFEGVSELIPAKHALFVLDCCFGGLVVMRSAPPVAAGLTNRARQAISAGTAEQAVQDAGGGGHSVFTGALLGALEGDADEDLDGVITFGELYNHVAKEVERKTESRQTPLQATFPDHEGGSVALFPPGTKPGAASAAERLKLLARTAEERLLELNRLSDALLVIDLHDEARTLWPLGPALVPACRDWLVRARDLLARLPRHEASVRRVRQEAYLSQVVAGEVEEGEGTEPDWRRVKPELRWRFDTFQQLVEGLGSLEELASDVDARLEVSSTLWQRSIGDHEAQWAEARAGVAELYDDLDLAPQLGLVPLGPDPRSGMWEFAHLLTGEVPERDTSSGKLSITEETGVVLVLVPGDTFVIGARAEDAPWATRHEVPAHEVTLTAYFLSKYEMTQGQWLRATGENPSSHGPSAEWDADWRRDGGNASLLHPVETVSWNDCERALRRVSLVLPTEAQWEYAARAWTDTPWWSGADVSSLNGVVNVADAYAKAHGAGASWRIEAALDDGFTVHAPVGSFRGNPMGFFDVHGNVWEWCRDGYGGYHLPLQAGDGERIVPDFSGRVVRGGGFDDAAVYARSSIRVGDAPEDAGVALGLRPAARVLADDVTTSPKSGSAR